MKISGFLDFLISFQNLKKINVPGAEIGTEIPSIPSLEEIHAESLRIFKGLYPGLRTVEIKSSDNLGVLRSAKNLEKIVIAEGLEEINYKELESIALENVKFAVLLNVPTFKVLDSFPRVEHLELQLYGLGRKDYFEKFDTGPFKNLGSLIDLSISTGSFWGDVLPFQDLSFPKLENLYLSCGCDLKNQMKVLGIDFGSLFSKYGQPNKVAFDLLDRFPSTELKFFGLFDDERWSVLDCVNHYKEKSALGYACRYPMVTPDWEYRPSYFLKWDYE